MRPIQLADIEAAARALCAVAADERPALAKKICTRADVADRYRKRLRRPHPEFGTGTVMSAATRFRQVPRPGHMTPTYLDAIVTLCSTLRRGFNNQSL